MKRITLLFLILLFTQVTSMFAQYTLKTNLPAVYIETFDGRSITSKDVYKYCRLNYVDESGMVTSYDSVSIRGRGNSTWGLSKKPYKIKFLVKEKFLGKGYAKCKKWTLLANAGDKTMMRNAVTSAMGAFTSLKFNPAAKFVDMILNGTYVGTYQISDQVDVRPHRVDITEQDLPLTDSSNITGGYLLEVDGFKDGNCFTTSRYSAPVRIHYPEEEDIVAEQTNYIRQYVGAFENALVSSNFTDAADGYRAYVDSASLIDWYICTEVSANIDGFFSTYFYKDQDDPHLYFGPLWDYDIAYNNDHRVRSEQGLSSSVNSLMVDIAYSGSKKWVQRMWEDPWFQRNVYERYHQLLSEGLVDYMHHTVDSLQELLNESQELNYQKWGIDRKMYHEMVLYSSYDQYVSDLKQFITDHCDYLLGAFAERKPEEPTPPFVADDYYYHIINAKTAKAMDVADNLVVQYTNDSLRESQDWEMKTVGEYYQLLNRSTGLALNDPTTGSVTATTNVGTQLNVAEPDSTDNRQLWTIVPQGTEGYYNLLNLYTQHIANLNGGSAADNASILSYTNDSRNGTSQNRLWYLVAGTPLPQIETPEEETPEEETPEEETPEETPEGDTAVSNIEEPEEYALAWNVDLQILHFGSSNPESLAFPVSIHTIGGQLVGTFRASEQYSMAAQPSGLYIVSWKVGGKTRSVKFRK